MKIFANQFRRAGGGGPDAAGALRVHRAAKTSSAQRVSVVLEKRVAGRGAEEGERGLRVRILPPNVVLKSDKRITASFPKVRAENRAGSRLFGNGVPYRIKDRTIVVVPRPQ